MRWRPLFAALLDELSDAVHQENVVVDDTILDIIGTGMETVENEITSEFRLPRRCHAQGASEFRYSPNQVPKSVYYDERNVQKKARVAARAADDLQVLEDDPVAFQSALATACFFDLFAEVREIHKSSGAIIWEYMYGDDDLADCVCLFQPDSKTTRRYALNIRKSTFTSPLRRLKIWMAESSFLVAFVE